MNILKKFIIVSLVCFLLIILNCINSLATTATVSSDTVRMRKEATTDSSVTTLLSIGDKIEVIEKAGEWSKVKYKGYTGYVRNDLIKLDEEVKEDTKLKEEPKKEDNQQKEETQPNTKDIQINVDKKVTKAENVYILPLINSCVIEQVKETDKLHLIQVLNGWAYISKNDIKGWIRYDRLSEYTEPKPDTKPVSTQPADKGYINVDSVNIRKEKSTTSEILNTLTLNTEVTILEKEEYWYKVKSGKSIGYISNKYISNKKTQTTSRGTTSDRQQTTNQEKDNNKTLEATQNTNTSKGSEIVAYAKTFLGCKYVYGGTSPTKGFDCSGYVQYVYRHFGYNISRSSSTQAKDGVDVGKTNLQLGDILIFLAYDNYKRIGHVGIYIGNNSFIHASDEKTGVITSSLSSASYSKRFITARRII